MAEQLSLRDAIMKKHIDAGTLPADIKLRATQFDYTNDLYSFRSELDDVLKLVVGVKDGELPDWARPDQPPPNAAHLIDDRYRYCEPYYALGNYRRTIFSDYSVQYRYRDTLRGQTMAWSRQVWMRVAPHVAPEVTDYLLRLEHDKPGSNKTTLYSYVLGSVAYRGEALFEFVADPEIDHDKVFHGVGKRAMNSLGALLLPDNPDHGDVLLPYAEAHEEWLDKTFFGTYS